MNWHNLYKYVIIIFTGHRFSCGDSPPPELPPSPPTPIGFTGCDSVENDPVVSSWGLYVVVIVINDVIVVVMVIVVALLLIHKFWT